jgi:hypothetical protein
LEPDSRVKRGLINGLGSVIKSITGNLDQSDALKYDNILKELQVNQEKIVSVFNNHISLNKEWMSHYSDILNQLIQNQNKINATIELIMNSNAYNENSLLKYAQFAQLLQIIGENVEDLILELNRIENMLAFIRVGTTHHSMVKVDILKVMIDRLKSIYDRNQVLDPDIREYYDIIKAGFYYNGKQIVIVFSIPIVSIDRYELYRLAIVPNKEQQVLIPPYPFLATNEVSFMYMEAECPKLNHWYLCEKKITQQIRNTPDCIQKLIKTQALDESCQFTTVTLAKEALDKLDDQHYIISIPNQTRIHSSCGREDIDLLQGSYMVTIPVKCSLRTAEFTITNVYDEMKGQPLKLTKIPYNKEMQITPHHLRLNTISLQGLQNIQNKAMMEVPPQLETQSSISTYYHTTIPFYIVVFSASVLAVALYCRQKYRNKKISTTSDNIEQPYQDPEEIRKVKREKDSNDIPATFSLSVLK